MRYKFFRIGQAVPIACWIPKDTNTHSKDVIHISFPLQQRLHKCTSVLRYMYIVISKYVNMFCRQMLSRIMK